MTSQRHHNDIPGLSSDVCQTKQDATLICTMPLKHFELRCFFVSGACNWMSPSSAPTKEASKPAGARDGKDSETASNQFDKADRGNSLDSLYAMRQGIHQGTRIQRFLLYWKFIILTWSQHHDGFLAYSSMFFGCFSVASQTITQSTCILCLMSMSTQRISILPSIVASKTALSFRLASWLQIGLANDFWDIESFSSDFGQHVKRFLRVSLEYFHVIRCDCDVVQICAVSSRCISDSDLSPLSPQTPFLHSSLGLHLWHPMSHVTHRHTSSHVVIRWYICSVLLLPGAPDRWIWMKCCDQSSVPPMRGRTLKYDCCTGDGRRGGMQRSPYESTWSSWGLSHHFGIITCKDLMFIRTLSLLYFQCLSLVFKWDWRKDVVGFYRIYNKKYMSRLFFVKNVLLRWAGVSLTG